MTAEYFTDTFFDLCSKASFVDTSGFFKKRALLKGVRGFVDANLSELQRFAEALEMGEIDEENYNFLLKSIAVSFYLALETKKSIRKTHIQYALNQIPSLIFGGLRAVILRV